MMSITAIKIPKTSTTMVQIRSTTTTTLIQRKILITSSYLIIANVNKVLILFKNMVNFFRMIFNSFNNIT